MHKKYISAIHLLSLSILPALLMAVCLLSCNTKNNSNKTPEKALKDGPRVLDERLELALFAENPDIVTPIGIAIDSLDRIFVLESHTHLPPKDYSGPKGDV